MIKIFYSPIRLYLCHLDYIRTLLLLLKNQNQLYQFVAYYSCCTVTYSKTVIKDWSYFDFDVYLPS